MSALGRTRRCAPTEGGSETDHQRRIPGSGAATVFDLLTELGLHPQGTVVERNREIVDREAFRDTPLAAGDVLELVRLVGGG